MPAIMAIVFTLMLCAFLSLFFLPLALFNRHKTKIFFIPALFTLSEWLRSFIFTGFPWLSLGYSQVPESSLSGYLPIIGIHGITFLVILSAILIFRLLKKDSDKKIILLISLIAIWLGGQILKSIEWTESSGKTFSATLIQGNITQDKKWDNNMINESLDRYTQLISKSNSSLVILPETSIPITLEQIPEKFLNNIKNQMIRVNGNVILGAIERKNNDFYNSAFSIGVDTKQIYRKYHLVPFGEFIPLRKYLGYIYKNWLNIPFNNLSQGPKKPLPINLNGQYIGINICYEDVFGNEITNQLPTANILVNMSNDAWYGASIAASQHLQISQARAIETGRMMLRATNTGVTAFIDVNGKVIKALPQFKTSSLTHNIQGYRGSTPYVILGNYPLIILCFLILIIPILKKLIYK